MSVSGDDWVVVEFWEARSLVSVAWVVREEMMVVTWALRWALRESTGVVRCGLGEERAVYFGTEGTQFRHRAVRREDLRGWNHLLRVA